MNTKSLAQVHTVTNTYEPDRDVLDTKTNSLLDGSMMNEYNYRVNAIGQRENLATSGSAFTEESATQWQIDYPSTYQGSHYPSYDGSGNVTEYLDEGGALIAHYEYDSFGNITKSSRASAVISEVDPEIRAKS